MKLLLLASVIGLVSSGAFAQFQQYRPNYQQPYQQLGAANFQPQPYQQYQARPRSYEGNAAILRSDADVNEQGFHYAYDTENGIHAEESGYEADGTQAQGSYSYVGDDGQQYSVRYSAGSNGVQVEGAHIPTPPPVPEEIARALQQNAQDEANGIFDDGTYHEGKYANDGNPGAGAVVAARSFTAQPRFNYRNQPRYY